MTVDPRNEYAPAANLPALIFSADMDPLGKTIFCVVTSSAMVLIEIAAELDPIVTLSSVPSITSAEEIIALLLVIFPYTLAADI